MTDSDDDRFVEAAIAEGGMPIAAGLAIPAGGGPGLAGGRLKRGSPNGERPRDVNGRFPELIRDLYKIVGALEQMFPGRPFTPDGHMVGSLAECYAQYHYGLELYPCSNPGHDAHGRGCKVEIKATQGNRVALRSGPERLLVFRLLKDGSFEEVYNGPGTPVWALVEGKVRPSNGQFQVSLAALRRLMQTIPESQRLARTQVQP